MKGRDAVRGRPLVVGLLALTVALVLADSAIVTLALPDILRELDGTVGGVAWVLVAFNLALAVFAIPAARLCLTRDPAIPTAVGMVVFGAASAACAVAGSIEVLIGARVVQAVGGAVALVGCLELLVTVAGERRGIARWTVAGVVGTAAGPVVGGLMTEAISWQSIFVVQVPLALLAVPAALTLRERRPAGVPPSTAANQRPVVALNLALALLSAALTAALFLLVLLLVEGWRHSPATAAVTVSVIPIAAAVAVPLARLARAGAQAETAGGCLLVAGGLAALALLPSAELGWLIAPQVLIGLGLGLTVDSLSTRAIADRLPRALHGGTTIAARHAGVVLGLALLTPVFTEDLRDAQEPAREAIVGLVLDAPLAGTAKIELATALGAQLQAETGRVPDLHPAFAALTLPPAQRPAAATLERALDDQLERAATRAFRDSYLIAAALALAAALPLPFASRSVRRLASGGPRSVGRNEGGGVS
ncbi:MAG: MFS transporter [Sporichthyaceae bacterium]